MTLRSQSALAAALIVAVGIFCYAGTLHHPFVFDDMGNIVGNPIIKNPSFFVSPSMSAVFTSPSEQPMLRMRFLPIMSFALNYRMGGLDPVGYHAVNIAIHLMNALVLWRIVLLICRTPALRGSGAARHAQALALGVGLIFVSHPVQTQAVTYIVQRMTCMAALFYLGSFMAYLEFRLAPEGSMRRTRAYALCLGSAVLGMLSKENAFTLPLVVALGEHVFFRGGGTVRGRVARLAPLFAAMLIIPVNLLMLGAGGLQADMAGRVGNLAYPIGPWEYFVTEWRVVLTYIRLLVLPVAQNIDYDYPATGLGARALAALAIHAGLMAWAGLMIRAARRGGRAELNLAGFGILWFYIALSVESSFIPLDVIFEHRLYLPLAGAAMAAGAGVLMAAERFECGRMAAALTAVAVVALSWATVQRNLVWASPVGLWADAASKSPHKSRPLSGLGHAYLDAGRTAKAEATFKRVLEMDPAHADALNALGVMALKDGREEDALEYLRRALAADPAHAYAMSNMGEYYLHQGDHESARPFFEQAALRLPSYATAHMNLGLVHMAEGQPRLAMEELRIAAALEPELARAHFNLGLIAFEAGDLRESTLRFSTAAGLDPTDADAQYNLGVSLATLGRMDAARAAFEAAAEADPSMADAWNNLGMIHLKLRDPIEAGRYFRRALEAEPGHALARENLERLGAR
jgi:Flp pilus assembly protein TadD